MFIGWQRQKRHEPEPPNARTLRVGPHSAEWMRRLEVQRTLVAAGARTMDRELLIDVVGSLCGHVGPHLDLDEYYELYDEQLANWVDVAHPEWISMGLELLADPPAADRFQFCEWRRWRSECDTLLSEIAEHYPQAVPDQVAPWLLRPGSREVALMLLLDADRPAALKWVRPLAEAPELTRSELLLLVNIVGGETCPSAREVLLLLRERTARREFPEWAGDWDDLELIRRTYLQAAVAYFLAKHLPEDRYREFTDSLALRTDRLGEDVERAMKLVHAVTDTAAAQELLDRLRTVLA